MAYEIPGRKLTLPAAADLSAQQYRFVKVDGNGNAALAGNGDPAIGVLQNKPTSGQSAELELNGGGGVSKVSFSGSIAPGTKIQSDANGNAVAYTSGVILGIVLEDGGALNQLGTVALLWGGTT